MTRPDFYNRRGWILGLGLAWMLLGSVASAQLDATQKADIGFTALQNRLGA